MFGIGKKQPKPIPPGKGFVNVKGIGMVEVEELPSEIPKKVNIGGKEVKVDKQLYKYLWANTYATEEGRKKLSTVV